MIVIQIYRVFTWAGFPQALLHRIYIGSGMLAVHCGGKRCFSPRGRGIAAPNWLLGGARPCSSPPRLDFMPYAWCHCLKTSWSVEVHPVGSWQFRTGSGVAISMLESAFHWCFDNSSVGLNYAVWQHHWRTIKINPFKRFTVNKFRRSSVGFFLFFFKTSM